MILSPTLFKSIFECDRGTYYQLKVFICFLAVYLHAGIQAQISHTAFLWGREAMCIYLLTFAQPLLSH